MFLVNSREASFAAAFFPLSFDSVPKAALIPKLRALFCRVPSRGFSRSSCCIHAAVHLCRFAVRIPCMHIRPELFLPARPTCLAAPEGLAVDASRRFWNCFQRPPGFTKETRLQSPTTTFHSRCTLPRCVTPRNIQRSAGILTGCPSATPFGLALGPTNPGVTAIAQETLDFR